MFEGWGAAVAGAAVVGGIASSAISSNAAGKAAGAQADAANAGIAQQNQQFAATQALLAPYVTAGNGALTGQQTLLGLNGNDAQQSAITALQNSPAYLSALQSGNTNILQNASATGGLRGGNTQGALAQFSPSLLSATINDQYNRLGGIATMGQNAAAQTGSFGQQNANNVSNLLGQVGSAQAGNALAQGNANIGYANAINNGIGSYFGMGGGFGGGSGASGSGNTGFGWKGAGGF